MNTDRDKRIAEELGLCWHEWILSEVTTFVCSKCSEQRFKESELPNPNFSTFDGMGLILQKGPEREWWGSFNRRLCESICVGNYQAFATAYIRLWLQDPDRLANELYTFLKEDKKRCPTCGGKNPIKDHFRECRTCHGALEVDK